MHFFQLKHIALNIGVVPPILSKYITENLNNPLNLDIEGNRDTLVEIAGMLNVLQETPYAKSFGIEGISAEDQIVLTQFYKDYKSNFDINKKKGTTLDADFGREFKKVLKGD